MFVLYAVVAGLIAGWVAGGSGERLAALHIRWPALIVAGMVGQIVLFTEPVAQRVGEAGPALYVCSTSVVLAALVRNLAIAGMPVVVAGATSNLVAVLANGGSMPASPEALAAAGRAIPTVYSNSATSSSPTLWPLTDVLALPSPLPLANVFSVGDVLIGLGIAAVIVLAMRPSGVTPSSRISWRRVVRGRTDAGG
jgi:cytochrome bd-type quinol oxidase subunit 2